MEINNYPNWLVPIEIAQQLKHIGFDVLVQNSTAIDVLQSKRYKEQNKIWGQQNILKYRGYNANKSDKGISLPTWEQVFEWFRDKGFIGSVIYYYDNYKNKPLYLGEIRDKDGRLLYSSTNIIETYEQAR